AMKHIGPSANRVERATCDVDQKAVLCCTFDASHNFLVEQVLPEHPRRAAKRCHDKINLPHTGKARMMSAWPGSVLVPRRPPRCAVLLDRHLAQRPYVPLHAVDHVPPECSQAAAPIFLGIREFQVAAA